MNAAEKRFATWLESLSPTARRTLASNYAASARADGAYVVLADGATVAIPPIVTPVALERPRMAAVSADAHAITAALCKLTADLMSDPERAPLRRRLFGAFTPLEAEALERTWRLAADLVTVRVDFLVEASGRARALEVNATIPAMQGYSDAIAAAFIRAVGGARGLGDGPTEALIDANGRNSDDLLDSLLAHHQRLGGRVDGLSIAIIARAGDAQYGELQHYVRRFAARGHRAFIATPDAARIQDGRAMVGEVAPDLIYRHVFARRLDPAGDFARMCLDPERFHVFNPLSSHLEVKGMLGLLSAAAGDDEQSERIGLDDQERAAIAHTVPWTRLLERAATRGPDGEAIPDLAAWVREHAPQLVLKRSWDYGGKGVFLGAELHPSRVAALIGAPAASEPGWPELVDFALADRDAWVVQELVSAPTMPHLRVEGGELRALDLYVDLSAFTNLGVAGHPSGGAVRASESRIVNILGGGGLAPLVRADVLERLLL
jgi:hypothetical protein